MAREIKTKSDQQHSTSSLDEDVQRIMKDANFRNGGDVFVKIRGEARKFIAHDYSTAAEKVRQILCGEERRSGATS